jgi:hypothetical protein
MNIPLGAPHVKSLIKNIVPEKEKLLPITLPPSSAWIDRYRP